MAPPYKPNRTFTGTYDDEMEGTATIDQINADQDEQNKMFDPASTHGDGTPGGIHKGNLMTGGSGSGIITEDDPVLMEDVNGDVTVTRDVIAGRNVIGDLQGDLKSGSTINTKALTDIFETDGVTVKNATNVTTNINGNAIADIFESDGTTVKNATVAGGLNGVIIKGCMNSNQSFSNTSIIQFNTKIIDTKNKFDTSLYRCTPGPGIYLVCVNADVSAAILISIRVNGSLITNIVTIGPTNSTMYHQISFSDVIELNEGDYIEFYGTPDTSATIYYTTTRTNFSIIQIA